MRFTVQQVTKYSVHDRESWETVASFDNEKDALSYAAKFEHIATSAYEKGKKDAKKETVASE